MLQIEPVTPDAYQEIADFLKNSDESGRSADWWLTRMRHWWDKNPAMSSQPARGFVITQDSSVVGLLGSIPTLVDTAEGIRPAASLTTWRVLPEHRKLSLPLLAKVLASKVYVHFNTTPADGVLPI